MKGIKKRCVLHATLGALLVFGADAALAGKKNDDSRSPLGCKDVGYAYDLNVLKVLPGSVGDSQSLYFIYNKNKNAVNLYQMRQHSESSQSVYLNHTIPAGRWAVLSTSERMQYICTVKDGKTIHGRVVDCAENLKVCEYARVKYGMNNRGNYWLANGNTRGGAVRQVIYYGIIPR